MNISVVELKVAIEKLLTLVCATTPVVTIEVDYYWDVSPGARYDNYKQPTDLSVGQLSDDWTEIRRILDGTAEPVPYALVWAAALLRRIGEQAELA